MGDILPAKITVYEDRTFDFVIKTPPTANLLKKYAHIDKGCKRSKSHCCNF